MTDIDFNHLAKRLAYFEGQFETHITVDIGADKLADFQEDCQRLGGKMVLIELDQGVSRYQPMFCRFHESSKIAVKEIRIAMDDFARHYQITRLKIEAAPQNQHIPTTESSAANMPKDCYFEHHVKLWLPIGFDGASLRPHLAPFVGHLSRNPLKKSDTGETRFVTQRFYSDEATAKAGLDRLLDYLAAQQINILDSIREYNVFDSNIDLDAGWMT